jgi:hypothetical protein
MSDVDNTNVSVATQVNQQAHQTIFIDSLLGHFIKKRFNDHKEMFNYINNSDLPSYIKYMVTYYLANNQFKSIFLQPYLMELCNYFGEKHPNVKEFIWAFFTKLIESGAYLKDNNNQIENRPLVQFLKDYENVTDELLMSIVKTAKQIDELTFVYTENTSNLPMIVTPNNRENFEGFFDNCIGRISIVLNNEESQDD